MSRAAIKRLRPVTSARQVREVDALAKQVQRLTRTIERQHTPKRRQRLTLGEFLPQWRAAHVTSRLKVRTREDYDRWLDKYVAPRFGSVLLEDIDAQAVESWRLEALGEGYKPKTMEPWLVLLRSILTHAAAKKYIEEVPDFSTSTPDTEQPWLKGHEFDAVVAAARQRDDMDLAIVLLGGDAGLRHAEMAGLRLPQVEDGTIIVDRQRDRHNRITSPKNGKARRVPMTTRLAEVIARLRAEAIDPEGYVITTKGRPMSYINFGPRFKRVLKKANIHKRVVLHSLRHTFISDLEAKGVSAGLIMKLVGHAKLSTTQRYLHVDEDQLQAAIEKLRR